MNITTPRMILRPFNESDLDDAFDLYRRQETCEFLLHNPWTVDTKVEFFQKKLIRNVLSKHSAISLACEVDHKVIGDISVWYTGMKETVEIGYAFHMGYIGKGYATEAIRGVIKYLFEVEQVHRIQATLDCRNFASAKLCQRVGMRKEGHFIKDYWNKGEWTDSFVYGMLKSDFIKYDHTMQFEEQDYTSKRDEIVNILDKLHTTDLGAERIKRNLSLKTSDVVNWCKNKIISPKSKVTRAGKNWYVYVDGIVITINANSYTIITAHKEKTDGNRR